MTMRNTISKNSPAYGAFKHVVILTDVEVHARRDGESIKKFGADIIKTFSSGTEAIDYLSEFSVDLVLCDSSLKDMTGIKFTQLVRKNMARKPLPIIMVTLENKKDHVLDAIASGCIGYVLRPYSIETFEKYLTLARQLDNYPEIEELELQEAKDMVSRGDFDDAIEAFEELISYQDEAQKYYDMGCKFLIQQKYGKAIVSFKKAVKINDLFAEAYKGLADAYKGKGDSDSCKYYLKKAADVYAQFDRLEETKEIFIEILKYDSEVPNPFNSLGVKLRKHGDYPGALHAYKQALELTPHDENIYYNMGKAYYFMGKKEDAADNADLALRLNANFPEAAKLYQRVHGRPWTPAAGKTAPPRPANTNGPKSVKDV